MTFNDLGLIEPILKALTTEGYERPTPIQEQAIPIILQKRDLLGCAQTGTGKTAAFALPILQLHQLAPEKSNGPVRIKTLILTPTRELAIQIGDSFKAYGRNTRMRYTVIFGGVGQQPQTDALRRGVEVLIATPGRLLDLMNQGYVHLSDLEIFVLDEADRMLDMGFIHDVRKVIAKLPAKRQTLFFSATMPPEIQKLADTILSNPAQVAVTPVSSTAEKVSQSLYFVEKKEKKGLLISILEDTGIKAALVFSRTKHGANKIAKELLSANISAEAIHGNKSQSARQTALSNFKNGRTRVLVATDIAARGIDIDDLAYVINYDLPNIPETYVHRIGRTGRAGASGKAISFCDREERAYLRDIEKLIGKKVPVAGEIAPTPGSDGSENNQERQSQHRQQQSGRQQQNNGQRRESQPQRPQQNERREQNNGQRRDSQPQRPQQNERREQNNGQRRDSQPQRPQQNERREQNNGQRRDSQPQRPQQNERREQNNGQRRDSQPQRPQHSNQRQQPNDRREQNNGPRHSQPQRPQNGNGQRPSFGQQPKSQNDPRRDKHPKPSQTSTAKVDWDDLDDLMSW